MHTQLTLSQESTITWYKQEMVISFETDDNILRKKEKRCFRANPAAAAAAMQRVVTQRFGFSGKNHFTRTLRQYVLERFACVAHFNRCLTQ